MAPRCTPVVLASLAAGAAGHGYMTLPTPRQAFVKDRPGEQNVPPYDAADAGCGYCSCCWYTNKISIPGPPTICDRALLTTGMATGGDPCGSNDWTKTQPWRAPGTAPLASPCGSYNSADGATLPPTNRTAWRRGATVDVAQAVTANHGGGYAYRLCPAGEAATEACFQAHHLQFADSTTKAVFPDGTVHTIQATRTTNGTTPAGSEWTKNPIPGDEKIFPAPFAGGSGSSWHFSLVDRVTLPADLAPGDYLLSWRWDCEQTPQVWANCADVTISA